MMQYLEHGLYPLLVPMQVVVSASWKGKLAFAIIPKIAEDYKTKSLRQLGKEYGVSHEAVRRTLYKAESLPVPSLQVVMLHIHGRSDDFSMICRMISVGSGFL